MSNATGTFPSSGHRMADPAIRVRTFILVGLLALTTWGSIRLLGAPSCAGFSQSEAREIAGLPVPAPCVSNRIPPNSPFSQTGVTP